MIVKDCYMKSMKMLITNKQISSYIQQTSLFAIKNIIISVSWNNKYVAAPLSDFINILLYTRHAIYLQLIIEYIQKTIKQKRIKTNEKTRDERILIFCIFLVLFQSYETDHIIFKHNMWVFTYRSLYFLQFNARLLIIIMSTLLARRV